MRKTLFFFLLFIYSYTTYSQSEDDFEVFGKEVYEDLVINDTLRTISFIRLREYREYIAQKVDGENTRQMLTNAVNENLLDTYNIFHQSVLLLYNSYHNALIDGASIQYLDTYHFKKEDNLPDSYTIMLSLLYNKEEMQNEIKLQFDVIWYEGMFLFLSPIKENF